MCQYRKENNCTVNNEICPWVYWCDKVNAWKELSKKPKECPIAKNVTQKKGMHKVEFARGKYLYVTIENQTFKLLNPFSYVPNEVKIKKYRGEWKVIKE